MKKSLRRMLIAFGMIVFCTICWFAECGIATYFGYTINGVPFADAQLDYITNHVGMAILLSGMAIISIIYFSVQIDKNFTNKT